MQNLTCRSDCTVEDREPGQKGPLEIGETLQSPNRLWYESCWRSGAAQTNSDLAKPKVDALGEHVSGYRASGESFWLFLSTQPVFRIEGNSGNRTS